MDILNTILLNCNKKIKVAFVKADCFDAEMHEPDHSNLISKFEQ